MPGLVVPEPAPAELHPACSKKQEGRDHNLGDAEENRRCRRRNCTWAELMKRVWSLDVLQCDRCGGRMRIVCANHPPEAVRSIMDCLGLPTRPPPIAPAASIIGDPLPVSAESKERNCQVGHMAGGSERLLVFLRL